MNGHSPETGDRSATIALASTAEFVEWEMVYEGKYYGTLESEMERVWQHQKAPLLDVDVKGGINIQQQYPHNSLSLFIEPPSIEELERRLKQEVRKQPKH